MKKTLALVLAALMTAGMTTVAFADAAEPQVVLGYTENNATQTMYVKDSDGNTTEVDGTKVLESGDKVYIPVAYWTDTTTNEGAIDGTELTIATKDQVERLKFYYEDELDSSASQSGDLELVKLGAVRYYCAVIEIPETTGNKNIDLLGDVMIGRTKNTAEDQDQGFAKMAVSLTYGPKAAADATIPTISGDEDIEGGIYKFDADDVVMLTFGDNVVAEFEVDVTGQGRLNLTWNTEFDSEIADKDKSANMDFLTFTGAPSFNKNGTMYIYADADTFLYQVVDGKLEAVDAEYDEDYEAWTFKTRTLGRYVISDKELDLEAINTVEDDTDSSSSTTDGGKENPDTGR